MKWYEDALKCVFCGEHRPNCVAVCLCEGSITHHIVKDTEAEERQFSFIWKRIPPTYLQYIYIRKSHKHTLHLYAICVSWMNNLLKNFKGRTSTHTHKQSTKSSSHLSNCVRHNSLTSHLWIRPELTIWYGIFCMWHLEKPQWWVWQSFKCVPDT